MERFILFSVLKSTQTLFNREKELKQAQPRIQVVGN